MRVGESRPLGHLWLFMLMPSRWTLTSRALTPAKLVCSAPKTGVIRHEYAGHYAYEIEHVVAHEGQIVNFLLWQHLSD